MSSKRKAGGAAQVTSLPRVGNTTCPQHHRVLPVKEALPKANRPTHAPRECATLGGSGHQTKASLAPRDPLETHHIAAGCAASPDTSRPCIPSKAHGPQRPGCKRGGARDGVVSGPMPPTPEPPLVGYGWLTCTWWRTLCWGHSRSSVHTFIARLQSAPHGTCWGCSMLRGHVTAVGACDYAVGAFAFLAQVDATEFYTQALWSR